MITTFIRISIIFAFVDANLNFIKNNPLFTDLDEEVCKDLVEKSICKKYNKGEYINSPGEPCNKVFIILSGLVKGGIYSESGQELTSKRYGMNDVLGLYTLFEKSSVNFFFQTIEKAVVLSINKSLFEELLQKNNLFCYKILNLVGKLFVLSVSKTVNNNFYNTSTQVVKFIQQLVEQHGKKIGTEIYVRHNLTQKDMANFIGCSRQSVSSVFSELRKNLIIKQTDSRSFLVTDITKLENGIIL